MSQPTEKVLMEMSRGRTAQILMGHLDPLLEKLRDQALSELKAAYRSGNFDQVQMLVKVGQLCSLEDLTLQLRAQINRAIGAEKEIRPNGPSN